MKYSDIRHALNTGDVVLFDGKGLFSWAIKKLTGKYSHVGMVQRIGKDVMLIESTTLSSLVDEWSGKKRKGVQMVSLSARIEAYSGKVYVRRLRVPLSGNARRQIRNRARKLRSRVYERSLWQLARSIFKRWKQAEDTSSLFCSELVGELWQAGGLIPEDHPSNEITPADFAHGRQIDKMIQGNSLTAVTRIERG